ncbi:MAG: FAD-dependent oxidoreductase [Saprospiraceae bacterium]|nr:FAD-dependent oxidoreductase [Saprospiraceae bacterium]
MPSSVLIIGGGVVGQSCAWFLQRSGHEVTLIDQSDLQATCSTGNAGFICPSHVVPLAAPGMVSKGMKMMLDPRAPFYIRPRMDVDLWRWVWLFMRHANHRHLMASRQALAELSVFSQHTLEDLLEETGIDTAYARKGLLMACRSARHLAEETAESEHARAVGLAVEVLSAREARDMNPELDLDLVGGVWYPEDTHLHPGRYLAGLQAALIRSGVRILPNTRVISMDQRKEQIVSLQTNHGELEADEVVLSGGAWSGEIAASLGMRLPVQGAKGYSFTLDNPPVLPQHPFILADHKVAVTPIGQQLRFAGTLELSGTDLSINPVRVERILEVVRECLPAFRDVDFSGIQPWAGLRPCSPDGLPYIGRWPSITNLTMATGHAMLGMTLGAGTGKLVAELLSDRPLSVPVSLFRPDRFR